ncbi:Os09g0569780, partial [Oryza sativa Japonica Group]
FFPSSLSLLCKLTGARREGSAVTAAGGGSVRARRLLRFLRLLVPLGRRGRARRRTRRPCQRRRRRVRAVGRGGGVPGARGELPAVVARPSGAAARQHVRGWLVGFFSVCSFLVVESE